MNIGGPLIGLKFDGSPHTACGDDGATACSWFGYAVRRRADRGSPIQPSRLLKLHFLEDGQSNRSLKLRPAGGNTIVKHARAQRGFPLYALPAQVSYLAVANLPPLYIQYMRLLLPSG